MNRNTNLFLVLPQSTSPTAFRTHHHGRSPSGNAAISSRCAIAAFTTHAAPRSTSAGPVCRPTLKRNVPMAYSSGTFIAVSTALTLAAASPV